jgi:hypothetical protein
MIADPVAGQHTNFYFAPGVRQNEKGKYESQ